MKNTELVGTRIDKASKEKLLELCKTADLNVTRYLRRLILADLKNAEENK